MYIILANDASVIVLRITHSAINTIASIKIFKPAMKETPTKRPWNKSESLNYTSRITATDTNNLLRMKKTKIPIRMIIFHNIRKNKETPKVEDVDVAIIPNTVQITYTITTIYKLPLSRKLTCITFQTPDPGFFSL